MKHRGFLANGGVSLAVHPTDENLVLVAGSRHDNCQPIPCSDDDADGIYRSIDGGNNWELKHQTHFFRPEEKKGGVNFAFASGNIVYAGTHEDGLLKSTDAGASWQALGVLVGRMILDVKLHPQDPSTLLLAVESWTEPDAGLFRYSDSTQVLEAIGVGLPNPDFPRAIAINPNQPNTVYVTVGPSGVYRSTDGGNTFAAHNGTPGNELVPGETATFLALSPVNPDHLYVSLYAMGGDHPFYSLDGGYTWQVPAEIDATNMMSAVNDDAGGEYWGTPIALHPHDENVAFAMAAADYLARSTDGGTTWSYSSNGYYGGRANVISFAQNDPQRFALFLTDFGVLATQNSGATFTNLRTSRFNDAKAASAGAIDPTDFRMIVAAAGSNTQQDLMVTTNEGQDWTVVPGTADYYSFIGFHPQNADVIYAGKFRSDNHGVTWVQKSNRVSALYPANGDIVYAVQDHNGVARIAKSTNRGDTWITPYGSIDTGTVSVSQDAVQAVVIAPNDEDRVYVATLWEGVFIWNGSGWDRPTSGFDPDRFGTLSTASIAIDPNRPKVVYAGRWLAFRGQANGVFRSLDYGQSWQNITYNLGPEFTAWSVSVSPHDGTVYVGSSHGTWKLPPPP